MTFFATPLPTSVDTVADLATSRARTRDGGVIQTAGYASVGDGGANQYVYRRTGRSSVTIDNGLYIAGSAGLDDYFEILDKSVVNVASFGANESGLSATETTARIQAAIAAMYVGTYTQRTLRFTPGHDYQINSLVIDSATRIVVEATGANFFLNEAGAPGFTISASNCNWSGGTFFKGGVATNPLIHAIKFCNSATATTARAVFTNVKARDIYRFLECYTNRALGTAYRLIISGCEATNTNATYKADSGSFGIRLDGSVAGDSSGNDSDVQGCKITGFYTNLWTNGAFTKLTGGTMDGAGDAGVELDGAAHFSAVNTYFEYNKYHYRYTNSPYQPRSYGCSYPSAGTTAYSTGSELSVSSSHLSYGDNNVSQLDTQKPTVLNITSAKGLDINVAQTAGTAIAARHNASGVAVRLEVTSNGIFEQFDKFWLATADPTTNIITATGHLLKVGENVRVEAARGATLPAGLSTSATAYQVKTIGSNVLTLEPLGGGAEVDITDAGSGDWYVVRNYGKRTSIGSVSYGDKLNGIHEGICHGVFKASTTNNGNPIIEFGRESAFIDDTNTTVLVYAVTDASTMPARNAAMKLRKDNTSGVSLIATGAVDFGGVLTTGPCLSTKPSIVHGIYRTPTANQGNTILEIGRDTYTSLVFGRSTSIQVYAVDDPNLPLAINCAAKFGRDANSDVSLNCSGFVVHTGTRNYYGFTDTSNNDLGFLEFVGTTYTLGTQKLGTGTARNVAISREGVTRVLVTATGLDLTGTVAVTGAMAVSGPVTLSNILTLKVQPTPADPAAGEAVIWINAAGDIQIKSNVGGTTKTGTILDYASMT